MAILNSNISHSLSTPIHYFGCAIFFVLIACSPPSNNDIEETPTSTKIVRAGLQISEAEATELSHSLWQQALQTIEKTHQSSLMLNDSVSAFLNDPNAIKLKQIQEQWHLTFNQYQQLLPFLFIEGINTLSQQGDSKSLLDFRFQIAAWPIIPAYIDAYDIYIHSGIVNDIALPLSETTLRQQHGQTDTEEVVLGLHAMEFLLWADKSEKAYKRFLSKDKVPLALQNAGLKKEELPNNRRRLLLKLQSELLVKDLALLLSHWQTDGSLSKQFDALPPETKLSLVNKSLYHTIEKLNQNLLKHGGESKDIDDLDYNIFSGSRENAFAVMISSIENIYFFGQPNLVNALLSESENSELKQLLSETKNFLNESQTPVNPTTLKNVQELLTLLDKSIIEKS
jgi:uncharacterized iron-regulated protein